jgi:hypothetical protein
MAVIGLLALALVALVVGLISGDAMWTILAIVLTVVAAVLSGRLVGNRGRQGSPRGADKTRPVEVPVANNAPPKDTVSSRIKANTPTVTAPDPFPVAKPQEYVRAAVPQSTLTVTRVQLMSDDADLDRPEPLVPEVWVVDGLPEYHVFGCATLAAAAEPIPYDQAISDGFMPCTSCNPDASVFQTPPPDAQTPAALTVDEVWVMDGEPDYHLLICSMLDDRAEAVPYPQAVEDGFAPCELCDPDAEFASTEPPSSDGWYEQPSLQRLAAASVIPVTIGEDEPVVAAEYVEPDEFTEAPEPEPVLPAAIVAEPEPLPEPVLEVAPEPEPEPVLAVQPEPEPAPLPEPEPVLEVVAEPKPVAVPEPAYEPTPAAAFSEAPAAAFSSPDPFAAALSELDVPLIAVLDTDVWVVDGKLRYHRRDCLMIKQVNAVPIPIDKAKADGFLPCPLCNPGR